MKDLDFDKIKAAANAYGKDMTAFLRAMISHPSESCEEGDPRRAYYENKINWCNLLLKHAVAEDQ